MLEDVTFTLTTTSLLSLIFRGILTYLILLFLVRIMGQRDLTQFTLLDALIGITVGVIAGTALINPIQPLLFPIIVLTLLALLHLFFNYLTVLSPTFQRFLIGRPIVVIENGKILENNLKKARLNHDQLLRQLRLRQIPHLADVEFAVMEPIGGLSAILKSDKAPITARDLNIEIPKKGMPLPVIMDGRILEENLQKRGLSETWLNIELGKQGGYRLDQINFAQIDTDGNLYVDLYDDEGEQPLNLEKPLLLANLKKVAADLENFSLQTENSQAKAKYQQASKDLNRIIKDFQPFSRQ